MIDLEEELVDILDENNQVIGQSSRKEAHVKGHIHRALSVLILNSKGKILLQKRSSNKLVHPLSWDISTSEHVLAGETYEDAGARSVIEELGVEVSVKLATDATLHRRKYELDKGVVFENEIVLMLTGTHEGPFNIDQNEVHSVEFFTVEEIEKMIERKEDFTLWFFEEWDNIKKTVKNLK